MSYPWFIYIIVISKPKSGLQGNIKTVCRRCCNDDAKKTTPVSGHETTAGNLHLNANGFMLISNYWDNDVLIGGKIKFAWTLAIQTEVRLLKKRDIFEGVICILICGMADSHRTQRRRDYCVWLRLWRNSSQSKPKPSWYCTLTPVSWMKRGCWRPSPPPISLLTSGSRCLWPSRRVCLNQRSVSADPRSVTPSTLQWILVSVCICCEVLWPLTCS